MKITRKPNLAAVALICALALAGACAQQQPPKGAAADVQQAPPHKDAAGDRTVLPIPEQPFAGKIGRTTKDSVKDFPKAIEAPKGAPNVLVIITDDVGFAASSTFGGPIPTPTMDRLANAGLRYNNFHTTALCSPTRAALLSGRNHHSANTGVIMELATGFPGYNSLMAKSNGTFAEILKQNGYNTSWYGKNHNVPDWQSSQAGPFDLWPTGLGFEYFYGFIGGDTSQWNPTLFEGTKPVEPAHDAKYFFDNDMADHAINWIRMQHATRAEQAVRRLLRTRHRPRTASRAQRVDREVQRQIRSGLGQDARGNSRAAEGDRRRPGQHQAD